MWSLRLQWLCDNRHERLVRHEIRRCGGGEASEVDLTVYTDRRSHVLSASVRRRTDEKMHNMYSIHDVSSKICCYVLCINM
jgi:hypothetical protein